MIGKPFVVPRFCLASYRNFVGLLEKIEMKKREQLQSRKLSLMKLREQRRKDISLLSENPLRKKNKQLFGSDIVEAPAYIDLRNGDEKLCHDFFENLRNTLAQNPAYIYLSFKSTRVLKATCVLVIYSIIDQAREINGVKTKVSVIWSQKSPGVNAIIHGSGKFLRAQEREDMIATAPTLPVIMGDNARVDELSEAITDYILDDEYYKDAPAEREQQIASAIDETVDNVGRHAYPDIVNHEDKKWWFCCDRVGDNLFIVFYDCGIGIPGSFSSSNAVMLARVNALYPDECKGATRESIEDDSMARKAKAFVDMQLLKKRLSDGQLIRAAMHVDVTSTDLNQHGQGSKSIKGLITDDEKSMLFMYSNKGFYCYSKEIEDNESSVKNREYKIQGTLVQWSI